jgi:beta-exotoxin I transport system ATP-binding protein
MLLFTESLTKDYGQTRALDGLSVEVKAGEVFGLLGPNGSGKSTALRLLMGFLRPTSGRAAIAGHDCWHDSVAARRHVAYLPGELRLYENLTGRELIRFLSRLRSKHPAIDVEALARRFDIDLRRPLAELSSGMKRKVALLQVLAAGAPLLILDEPTNTLDPTMRDELLGQIRAARDQGQAVLFSSHVLTEVEQVCDRVGVLQLGKLVHLQTMASLRQERRIRVRFGADWEPLPLLEGLSLMERVDHQLVLEYTGELPPLLAWLSRQPVADMQIESRGLGAVYQRYHGAEE